MIRTTAAVVLTLSLTSPTAYAAGGNDDTAPAGAERPKVPAVVNVDWSLKPVEIGEPKRPAALPALYASFLALQVFDAYSTTQGLSRGASEANPIMRSAVGTPATFWAIKAATTAGVMITAERMWKTNKAGAIAVMVIGNGVAAAIAARNASVLKQLR